jgi:SAM-dependent methyltransferase
MMDDRLTPPPEQPAARLGRSGLRFDPSSRAWLRSARPWHRLAYIIRVLPRAIARGAERLDLESGTRVLDFGCGEMPYRHLFGPQVQYVGADLPGNPAAEVEVSDSGHLRVPDQSFDVVVSTQVLEHVRSPSTYLEECFRVLRPGGRLLLSTHGTMILHPDPIDLWRWTSDGLRYQVELAGLRVVAFAGVMGLAATGLQLFQDATHARLPAFLRAPYALVMQALVALCDRLDSDRSRAYNALVYTVVAERPATPRSN